MYLKVVYEYIKSEGMLYCFEVPEEPDGQPSSLNESQYKKNIRYLGKLTKQAQDGRKRANETLIDDYQK